MGNTEVEAHVQDSKDLLEARNHNRKKRLSIPTKIQSVLARMEGNHQRTSI